MRSPVGRQIEDQSTLHPTEATNGKCGRCRRMAATLLRLRGMAATLLRLRGMADMWRMNPMTAALSTTPRGVVKRACGGCRRRVVRSSRYLSLSTGRVLQGSGWHFFVPGDASAARSIQFFSFRTGAVTVMAPIDGIPDQGLSVSPDARYILYSQSDQQSGELMLLENFFSH